MTREERQDRAARLEAQANESLNQMAMDVIGSHAWIPGEPLTDEILARIIKPVLRAGCILRALRAARAEVEAAS